MTVGTGIAYAIDRASNQTQARILCEYERRISPAISSADWTRRQLDICQMPVSCLMFLIAEPCWKVEE
jgi:hypothetical protein